MLRSASGREEDSNATGVDSWEHFCREEARQAACSFLERVKRFKSRNAAARDVHDSTFTNEFSAAFLEESSVLMASGDTQLQACAVSMNGQSQSHGFSRSILNRSASTRAGGSSRTFVREESKASVKSSSGKKGWWSNIFKWSKSKRDRRNNSGSSGLSSSGEYLSPSSSRSNSSSHQQGRRRVILDGQLQLLDLNETEGPLQWTPCKLVLAEAQGHHQVEIFMPPKSSVARTTLFCFLIEDVRSTTALEIPDSTTCFVIKSQNHGEHVFKSDTEVKKQRWIQALLDCKSQIIRSASAQTHLATLPRTPQRTPVRLPNGSTSRGVISLDASPVIHCSGGGSSGPRYASYASSESSEQKKSTLNVGAESDGEDSMMDVTSLIRRLNHASPSRRRKVQSMFVDSSNLHSIHPTTATATMMTCAHYQPPPLLSYSPPNYEDDYPHHQPPSLPARLPFSSLPADCSNSTSVSTPPPLPKRNPPARSTSTSLSSSTNQKLPSYHGLEHHNHTSPSHMTHPVSSAVATATSVANPPPLPPMSTARLTAISTTNDITSTSVNSTTCSNTNGGSARIQASPRRKYSQSFVDIPPTIHSGSSQGNLELCSQSSSSSALHPVSLAAVQRSMAATNGRRRSSITSNPGDSTTQPMSLMNFQALQKPNDRVRKTSAPVLIADDQAKQLGLLGGEDYPLLQKKVGNGAVPGQKNVYDSSDILAKETSPVPESDREQEEEERAVGDGEGERERERENGRDTKREKERERIEPGVNEETSFNGKTGGGNHDDSSGVAKSALSLVQGRQNEENSRTTENGINYNDDEANSRKATFTFPHNSSQASQTSQASNSSCSPPVPPRTSSPLLIQQRSSEARGRSGSPLTPDLVTSHLSYNHRSPLPPSPSQQESEESEGGGLMTGTLVAGTGMGPGPLLGAVSGGGSRVGGGASERRGHRRGHSLISSHSIQTNPSTRTNSSSSDGTESNPANVSAPGISNPIYVETTEGERARVSQQVELHTQHPYEHWATSQQDVANLRLLSRYPWFHGMVSRANASQLVLTEGESGTGKYLVRQSESREGDFVLTFNYHNRAKHLRMAVDEGGCNIQHLWFDDVPNMLDYFKTNSIPLESFWLNDDVKLTTYIDRQASDSFRTTTVVNMDRLARVPPRRSRSLHLGMANSVNSAATTSTNSSNPGTPLPLPLDANASSASSPNSQSTNSLPQSARNSTGWRLFRSQRSSSAGNVGRVQRRHSANVGALLSTGTNSNRSSGRRRRNNNENAYLVRNY